MLTTRNIFMDIKFLQLIFSEHCLVIIVVTSTRGM